MKRFAMASANALMLAHGPCSLRIVPARLDQLAEGAPVSAIYTGALSGHRARARHGRLADRGHLRVQVCDGPWLTIELGYRQGQNQILVVASPMVRMTR